MGKGGRKLVGCASSEERRVDVSASKTEKCGEACTIFLLLERAMRFRAPKQYKFAI